MFFFLVIISLSLFDSFVGGGISSFVVVNFRSTFFVGLYNLNTYIFFYVSFLLLDLCPPMFVAYRIFIASRRSRKSLCKVFRSINYQ